MEKRCYACEDLKGTFCENLGSGRVIVDKETEKVVSRSNKCIEECNLKVCPPCRAMCYDISDKVIVECEMRQRLVRQNIWRNTWLPA